MAARPEWGRAAIPPKAKSDRDTNSRRLNFMVSLRNRLFSHHTDTVGVRRFSTEAYHRMGEASVFGHEEHVEDRHWPANPFGLIMMSDNMSGLWY